MTNIANISKSDLHKLDGEYGKATQNPTVS
jgi:hypothetical protein